LRRIAAFDEVDIRLALTRGWPAAWGGYRGRIDQTTLADASWTPDDRPLIYVSGSASFNDAMRDRLISMGHHPSRVRVTGDPGS
jgi:ferredoxin-NADP reductase